jgi:hypothetical protein
LTNFIIDFFHLDLDWLSNRTPSYAPNRASHTSWVPRPSTPPRPQSAEGRALAASITYIPPRPPPLEALVQVISKEANEDLDPKEKEQEE